MLESSSDTGVPLFTELDVGAWPDPVLEAVLGSSVHLAMSRAPSLASTSTPATVKGVPSPDASRQCGPCSTGSTSVGYWR